MVVLSIIIVMSDEHAQKLVDNAYVLDKHFLWVVKKHLRYVPLPLPQEDRRRIYHHYEIFIQAFPIQTRIRTALYEIQTLQFLIQQIAPITSDLFESIERLTQFQCDIVCIGPTQAFISMSRFKFIPWDMEKNSQIRLFLWFHMRIWYVSMLCWHSLFSSQRTYELDTWHIHDFSKSDVVITIKMLIHLHRLPVWT